MIFPGFSLKKEESTLGIHRFKMLSSCFRAPFLRYHHQRLTMQLPLSSPGAFTDIYTLIHVIKTCHMLARQRTSICGTTPVIYRRDRWNSPVCRPLSQSGTLKIPSSFHLQLSTKVQYSLPGVCFHKALQRSATWRQSLSPALRSTVNRSLMSGHCCCFQLPLSKTQDWIITNKDTKLFLWDTPVGLVSVSPSLRAFGLVPQLREGDAGGPACQNLMARLPKVEWQSSQYIPVPSYWSLPLQPLWLKSWYCPPAAH